MAALRARALSLVVVLLIVPRVLSAQSVHRPYVGVSVGLGNSTPALCDACKTGFDIGGRLGVSLEHNLAIGVEGLLVSVAPNVLSKEGGKHEGLLGTVQFWPADRFWVKAGLGGGFVERHNASTSDRSGHPAALLGGGFDINPHGKVVFDASASALVSGDTETRFSNEPAHKSSVTTGILALDITWRPR